MKRNALDDLIAWWDADRPGDRLSMDSAHTLAGIVGRARTQRWLDARRASPEEQPAEPEALTLDDLRPLLVEGWEMPEAPRSEAVALACFGGVDDDEGWALVWSADDKGREVHIPWPFLDGVEVTADMLRALGFVVGGVGHGNGRQIVPCWPDLSMEWCRRCALDPSHRASARAPVHPWCWRQPQARQDPQASAPGEDGEAVMNDLDQQDPVTARELLHDVRECFELDPKSGGPLDEEWPGWMKHPRDYLTWDRFVAGAEGPVDRCSYCDTDRPCMPGSPDRCEACGTEGHMCTGYRVTLWLQTAFVSFR